MSYPYSQIFPPPDRFGDVIGGDYSEFEPDGFLLSVGGALAWKDLDIGGVELGAGASAPDLVAIAGGTILLRAFDGGVTTEQLFGCKELDHDYAEGTNLYPHVHWAPTTAAAGNVKWQLTCSIGVAGAAMGVGNTIEIVDTAPGVAWQPKMATFPAINGAALHIGNQIAFRLFRDPNADTYGADAVLLTFGFHIQVNSLGSRNISSK